MFLKAVRRRLLVLISELRIRFQLEIEAAQTPLDELRRRLDALNRELEAALQQDADSQFLMQGHLGRLCSDVAAAVRAFADAQEETLRPLLEKRLLQVRGLGRRQMAGRFTRDLRREIESPLDAFLPDYERQAGERLRELTGRFAGEVNGLMRRVREAAGALFGVELHGPDAEVELVMTRGEGYHTDPLTSWGLGSLPLLLPGPLYRRRLRAQIRRQVPLEPERNAKRRAYDLGRRLEPSAALFRSALKRVLEETIERTRSSIEAALALPAAGEAPAARAIERRRAAMQLLRELECNRGGCQ